jgi:hypothetical protein
VELQLEDARLDTDRTQTESQRLREALSLSYAGIEMAEDPAAERAAIEADYARLRELAGRKS